MLIVLTEEMRAKLPKAWSFEFWKEQFEQAPNFAAAHGVLHAANELYLANASAQELYSYLVKLAEEEEGGLGHPRFGSFSYQAMKVLNRNSYTRRFQGDTARYISVADIELALWFYRPKPDLSGLVNRLQHKSDDNENIRRHLRNLCWWIWIGGVKEATLAHKLQVLDIYYATNGIQDLTPASCHHGAALAWRRFEDVLPHLEKLALLDVQKNPSIETVEEAAFSGYQAAQTLVLLRTVLPAAKGFYARHELKRLREKA